MEAKIMGGSAGIRLPKAVLQQLGLEVGDAVEINVIDGRIVLHPMPSLSLEEMLATCTPENTELTNEEREWLNASPVGKEIL